MANIIKLVDQSHRLSKTDVTVINTKTNLFRVLRDYLDKLFGSADSNSKLFWAMYSVFVVKKNRICFCSAMGTRYPLYNVDVEKVDHSSDIRVKPYKIDGYKKYTIKNLCRTYDKHDLLGICHNWTSSNRHLISPLQVLGYSDDVKQCWKGTVTVRTNFTEWNNIYVKVNRYSIENTFHEFDESLSDSNSDSEDNSKL